MSPDSDSSSDAKSSSNFKDALHETLAKLTHLDLTGRIQYVDTVMKASGGYCDVFTGKAIVSRQNTGSPIVVDVAIKRLRIHIQKEPDFEKFLAKELYIWSRLNHRNVLPLEGFALEGDCPVVISEWMINGTLREYLQKEPNCNVEDMILAVAKGVDYLHRQGVVHSDLKADNVLIDRVGVPVICDFGISRMVSSTATFARVTSGGFRGSMRWMAYELLDPSGDGHHTTKTDVWAFGMTVLEILTRELPYAHLRNDGQVMRAITAGILPSRPSNYKDWPLSMKTIWDTCQKCWMSPPEHRITIQHVVQIFGAQQHTSSTVKSKDIPDKDNHLISTLRAIISRVFPTNTKAKPNRDKVHQVANNPVVDHSKSYTREDFTVTVQPSAREITTVTTPTTTLTTDFAPVPVLSPVVAIVIDILQLCNNVPTNNYSSRSGNNNTPFRHEIRQLGNRCTALLYALRDNSNDCAPRIIESMVDLSQKLVGGIQLKMKGWIQESSVGQFFLPSDIAKDIRHCHQDINSFLEIFDITCTGEAHQWMPELENTETLDYLSDSNNNQQIHQEASTADQVQLLTVMECMQEFMSHYSFGNYRHRGLQANLLTIQKTSGLLLPRVELRHGEVCRVSSNPVGGSAAFDIWQGEYLGQEKCAIKVIRGIEVTPKIRDRFLRELTIWKRVSEMDKGEYMLPFWGACLTDGPYPYMVSPWMPYGDAITYVNKYPYVDRKRIIRRIAEGLRLLHTHNPPIAHGDIKGANILINEKSNPLLTDFGLSKTMEDLTGMPFTQSRGVAESYRWFAPELCSEPGVLSLASDIYAYSMTVVELMTSQPPFSHIKRTPEVLIKMQQGERPRKPESPEIIERGLDNKLWDLLARCWVSDPETRPSIHEVIAELPTD